MAFQIVGTVDENRLYCAGSFSKLLTTFASLSLLSEKYKLNAILDDNDFLDNLCQTPKSRAFLSIFQHHIGSQFTLHDIGTYYAGLPYTFDISEAEIESVDAGNPFKHHSVPDEKTFLYLCENKITPVYKNRCKFHYSEVSILFLGYLIEQIYETSMESLYAKYIIHHFNLKNSYFSRKMIKNVYKQDLSDAYDFASIAINDHGYFCYSNGFYTTLHDEKILLEGLVKEPVFQFMSDINLARAASNRLMNGLANELRMKGDDLIVGYDGLSFSGCNLWAYSKKSKQGYLTFNDSGDLADKIIFDQFNYTSFDTVPERTQEIYKRFIKNYSRMYTIEEINIPIQYQGQYQRVTINDKILKQFFILTNNTFEIRNPEFIKYDIISVNNIYRIKCKDNVHGGKIGLYEAKSGNKYVSFGGVLLKKICSMI